MKLSENAKRDQNLRTEWRYVALQRTGLNVSSLTSPLLLNYINVYTINTEFYS